jgi:hypothetical protein
MAKLLVCVMAVVFFSAMAMAEPKAEVFGGYQLTHFDGGPNASGWNAALTGNFNSWLGITADFSGVYPSGINAYTYTFGPKISAPLPVVKPFVHALFGGARLSSGSASINGFDMMIGGGADVGHGIFAWRVVQFDWMSMRFNGVTNNKNVRVSTGMVLRF